MAIKAYMRIEPLESASSSARVYLPAVIAARGFSVLRLWLVALILGDMHRAQFGLYQPALELINWLVPLLMLGMADVAERYAATLQASGSLRLLLQRQLARIAIMGCVIISLCLIASPWLLRYIWSVSPAAKLTPLVVVTGATVVLLAAFQFVAAMLRGLRAYRASVGLELASATLFLFLSTVAAFAASATLLVVAYALSLALPLAFYLLKLFQFLPAPPASDTATTPPRAFRSFAFWAFLRLLLVMTFSFIAIWSVGHLALRTGAASPQEHTAEFSLPYRLAQLLAFLAVAGWSSIYGIAASHYAPGHRARSRLLVFRMMYYTGLLLYLAAATLFFARDLIAYFVPYTYQQPLSVLLPPSLAIFLWYSFLCFATLLADLHERPHFGVLLWLAAVIIQLLLILKSPVDSSTDPKPAALYASAVGIGAALLCIAPLLTWRPLRLTPTSIPIIIYSLAPLALLAPPWVVNWVASPVLLFVILFSLLWTRFANPLNAVAALLKRN